MKKKRASKKARPSFPWIPTCAVLFVLVLCGFLLRADIGHYAWNTFGLARTASYLGVKDAGTHFALGEYFFQSGDTYDVHRAQYHYTEATRLDPRLLGAHYQLGRTYFILGYFDKAYAAVVSEELLRPEFGKVHYMKGLIAGYMKNFELAELEFKKFIEYDSFNWAGYNDLSWIYFAQGNYHYAEATAREGLIHAAGNPWLHNAVGVALLAQDRGAEALPHFKEAQKGFQKMNPDQWGIAYPGNSPHEHGRGLDASQKAIERNIERAENNAASVENNIHKLNSDATL